MAQSDIEDIQKRAAENAERSRGADVKRATTLAPIRHPQQDFSWRKPSTLRLETIRQSMEHPMFSLSKAPDPNIRVYEHNGNSVGITPSANGLATIWDKDILLFAISTQIEAHIEESQRAATVGFELEIYSSFATVALVEPNITVWSKRLSDSPAPGSRPTSRLVKVAPTRFWTH